jgi:hypothetical protein
MSEQHLAPCGLNCAVCEIYVATKADSDDMRQQVADKWTRMFHHPFTKDDINCDGCLGGGRLGIYCETMCEIRPCALQRGLTACTDCPDYLCEKLRKNQEASAQYEQ